MRLTAQRDVAVPPAYLWRRVSDVDALEARIAASEARIRRTAPPAADGTGVAWDLSGRARGRTYTGSLRVAERAEPERMVFQGGGHGFDTAIALDVTALTRVTARMSVAAELTARSLPARVLLPTLRLARSRIEGRMVRALERLALEFEADWRDTPEGLAKRKGRRA